MGCLFPRLFTPPDETFRLLLLQRPYVLILAWSLAGFTTDTPAEWWFPENRRNENTLHMFVAARWAPLE